METKCLLETKYNQNGTMGRRQIRLDTKVLHEGMKLILTTYSHPLLE